MKQKNNLILWTLVLILLSSSIFAQEPPHTFNPDDPSSFDYVSGDYTTIDDWSKVEWNKIPTHRIPEVPAEQLDYSQINAQQRLEMNVEQISNNLHNIENLATDVKEDRAREAIQQNYQVTVVSLGSNAKIVNNVLLAEFGEEDTFNLDGKPAWKLEIGDDGIIRVLEPTEIIEQKITQQDSFTLVTETRFTSQSRSVSTIQHLSFKNGQAYVREGDTAKIGDYQIPAESNPVDVYFEPTTKPTGNYISISEDGLDIGTTQDKTVKIIPQPGNKLFNMVKRDYSTDPPTLVPSERDTLAITVSDGDGLEIISRADSGKTPMFRHHDGNGETEIETGRMSFRIKDDNLRVTPPKPFEQGKPIDFSNSVAFELQTNSEKMKETVRTSSSNRFIVLRNGKTISGNNMGLKVSDTVEDNLMKTVFDLKHKYPDVKFTSGFSDDVGYPNAEITANMAQALDEWVDQKPDVEKIVQEFHIHTGTMASAGRESIGEIKEPVFLMQERHSISVGERVLDPSTVLQNPVRDLSSPLDVVDHEFIHIQDHIVETNEKRLTYSRGPQTTPTLEQSYAQAGADIAGELYKDPQFIQLLDEVGDVAYPKRIIDYVSIATGDVGGQPASQRRATLLADIGLGLERSEDPKAKELLTKWNAYLRDKTGLYTYSFYSGFAELPSTYAELPPQRASRSRKLAQLEYDRVMSLDPPQWMRQQAEERYYKIMGGREGSYCQTNPCGSCLIYTLTCQKE